MSITTSSKRIEYIDALRGFTMILVVFSHIFIPGVRLTNNLFITFRMPLFFFISGYIAYKANEVWDFKSYIKKLSSKCRIQLIPTIVFGLLFAYSIRQHNVLTFITDCGKDGYWFTFVLLEMFFLYYTYNFIFEKIRRGGGIWCKNFTFYFIALIIWALPYVFGFLRIEIYGKFTNILSLPLLGRYLQFFALGILFRQHQEQAHKLLDNKYISAGIILLFAGLFGLLQINQQYQDVAFEGIIQKVFSLTIIASAILVRYLGLLLVYSIFRKYQNSFSQESKVGSSLQYIGRHTLDIYVLHYFFLPNIAPIKDFILNTTHYWGSPNIVLELFFGIGISLMVIAVCLIVSKILRTSDLLAHYLFGAKIQKEIK